MIDDPSLNAGHASLDRGDFEAAIAHFRGVADEELDEALAAQAQQALIVAYIKSDRLEEAIDLCAWLAQDLEVNPWAATTLADLRQRYEKQRLTGDRAATDSDRVLTSYQTPTETEVTDERLWRCAGRAEKWQPLKSPSRWRFWGQQLLSAIAIGLVVRFSLAIGRALLNELLSFLPFVRFFLPDPTPLVLVSLPLVFATAPWLLELIFARVYRGRSLRLTQLSARVPETTKFLQRYCRKANLPVPKLSLVPTEAPIIFSYGHHPRTARIALSEGLLSQIEDADLAPLLAAQLAAIAQGDLLLLSGTAALLQLPYLLYWQLSLWGDRRPQPWQKNSIALLASIFYGVYTLWRLPILWFSRRRVYYSDRFATNITGDPNGLARALLKVEIGIARHIERQQQTDYFLESNDILLPVSPRHAASLGSIPHYTPWEAVLAWECTNPYRHWLKLDDSHALLGDRLYLLGLYATNWQLAPEIDLPKLRPAPKTWLERLTKLRDSYRALPILQTAILSGLAFGLLLRGFFWTLGTNSRWLGLDRFSWLQSDALVDACVLFAFSISTLIWVNSYFPDIDLAPTRERPRLQELLANRRTTPANSLGVRLTGTLGGRPGLGNALGQDWFLHLPTGTVRLQIVSRFGPLGNIFALTSYLQRFRDREVTVRGWLRRASTVWIDVDALTPKGSQTIRGGTPIWVTAIAMLAAIAGAYRLWSS